MKERLQGTAATVAAILAGGSSRRMGRDKALLPAGGETWLARVVREAAAVTERVLVVGREPPPAWSAPADTAERVAFVPDEQPGQGPLGGLITALHRAEGDVVALACDMPLVDVSALRWLLEAAAHHPDAAAVAAVSEAGIEPLFAVYRQTVLPLAEARLARGERSLRRLVEAAEGALCTAPPDVAERLANVNDVEALRRLGLGAE